MINAKEIRSPINVIGDHSYLHMRHNNLFFVAVTSSNVNASMVFEFLTRTVEVLKAYFQHVDEEGIRNNIFLIYELMDELVDFGYPQVTSPEILKMSVMQQGTMSEDALQRQAEQAQFTVQATGAVSHRREGIKYRKNEVFLDVIESVNLLVSAKGTVLRSDVSGKIVMKAYLTGMPDCKFGLNDKLVMDKEAAAKGGKGRGIDIDDVKFHQCVKLGKFDTDRSISFVPPDGEFELMRYRVAENINLPFRVIPMIKELGRTRLEYKVTVKAPFSDQLFANNVVVKIPCPENTAGTSLAVGLGRAKFDSTTNCIMWKIKRWQGMQEFTLAGEVSLVAATSEAKAWSRPPIEMEFQVPMFTASGLKVRYLKVFERASYQTTKWVRYMTKGGSYQHRI